jgi:hypothetical protein
MSTSLEQEVENLKKIVSDLYIPKHLETMMQKVGKIEKNSQNAMITSRSCYTVLILIAILFSIIVFILIFGLWKLRLIQNYIRFISRDEQQAKMQLKKLKRSYSSPDLCHRTIVPKEVVLPAAQQTILETFASYKIE